MNGELERLALSLREIFFRPFDFPVVPRDLVREVETLSRWLGAVGGARPPRDRMREAMAAFRLSGELLTLGEARLVCFGAIEPLDESQPPLIEDERWFLHLLAKVEDFASNPRAFRRCYRGLLHVYFSYDPDAPANNSAGKSIHRRLGKFLHGHVEDLHTDGGNPAWVLAIREHSNLLTVEPVQRYGAAVLRGNRQDFDEARAGLEIDENSWVMRLLVLAQVQAAIERPDHEFTQFINALLELLKDHALQRDEGLALLLDRYQGMQAHAEHAGLRDAAIQAWGSPWMTKNDASWARVKPESRRMVRNWLNLKLIKQFFDVLAEDQATDKRRVRFWEKYHTQVEEIYFALGPNAAYSRSADIRDLRKEMGAHLLWLRGGGAANNAFIMRIGGYVIVEFGVSGNACFVFRADRLPFALHGDLSADSAGLKHPQHVHRLLHVDRAHGKWEEEFATALSQLGIRMGVAGAVRREPQAWSTRLPAAEKFSWAALGQLADQHGLSIEDGTAKGGRLRVNGARERGPCADQLLEWGFRWAPSRNDWYLDK